MFYKFGFVGILWYVKVKVLQIMCRFALAKAYLKNLKWQKPSVCFFEVTLGKRVDESVHVVFVFYFSQCSCVMIINRIFGNI